MEKINNIISKKNYFSQYGGSMVCYIAKDVIENLSGEKVKIVSVKNRVLKIKAANNFAAIEIRSKKSLILDEINKKTGKTAVKNIRFV